MKKYRKNAGIIVFNKDKKVLICERIGNWEQAWQFPQGGIDEKETAQEAAIRELKEETSIISVKAVVTETTPLMYDFPPEVKANSKRKGRDYDGQAQYWSLFLFLGEDSEINLQTEEPEFQSWKWIDIEDADKNVVSFKKEVYRQIINKFKPIIQEYKIL